MEEELFGMEKYKFLVYYSDYAVSIVQDNHFMFDFIIKSLNLYLGEHLVVVRLHRLHRQQVQERNSDILLPPVSSGSYPEDYTSGTSLKPSKGSRPGGVLTP